MQQLKSGIKGYGVVVLDFYLQWVQAVHLEGACRNVGCSLAVQEINCIGIRSGTGGFGLCIIFMTFSSLL